jgi:hypothetical protein
MSNNPWDFYFSVFVLTGYPKIPLFSFEWQLIGSRLDFDSIPLWKEEVLT